MFVYICHPIRGNSADDKIKNLKNILKIVRTINLTMPEVVPLVNYFADCLALCDGIEEERRKGLENDRKLLESGIVDELWVFGDEISEGMREEIEIAQKMGIPIKHIEKEVFFDFGV
ncbi:DUF4406 domain-containing protein [Hippea maritima]|uniref:DUF7768 domain-containing protein n=1 Tax=Hippea maritima (strain ATCC 700847 / DSM 10411 / MH2) TaxID=760142 RepID=F2LV19_HIPMA|nr:DUF4406 domain-containing protein [Hippea maritima]AEA33603.1 hypothetical protein Hipma_0633 [Hippea maritima DSM 10411]